MNAAITTTVPWCTLCAAPHEPEEPHELTAQFRAYIRRSRGREATTHDRIAHTTGLIRTATEAALRPVSREMQP